MTEEYLQECDLCHDLFPVRSMWVSESGKQVYCERCTMDNGLLWYFDLKKGKEGQSRAEGHP